MRRCIRKALTLREKLPEYAKFMKTDEAAMEQLSPDAQEQVRWLADESKLKEYCPDSPRKAGKY